MNTYVIDSGVDASNHELYVVRQVDFTSDPNRCEVHGTAVAGVIGARDNTADVVGIAPGVPITDVRVVDCSGVGTESQALSGIDWVTAHALKPAVANMSLAYPPSQAIDDAVATSADSGIVYTVSAGNDYGSCEQVSPARIGSHPGVLTVGATEQNGAESEYSNFGPCVGIWAPGFVLTTAQHGGDTFAFGTGISAPHVTGTASLYLSNHPRTSPRALKRVLERDGELTGFTSKDGSTPVLQIYAGKY